MSQLAARPTGTRSAWKAVAAASAASGSESGPPSTATGARAAARQSAAMSVMRAAAAGRAMLRRAWLITLRASASPPGRSPGHGRSFEARRSGHRVLGRPAGELGAPRDPRLRADVREMALDGARRDVQRRADLLVRPSLGDEAQHVQLADGERSGRREPAAARLPAQSAHEMPEQVGADRRLAALDGVDRLAQLRARDVLRDEAG